MPPIPEQIIDQVRDSVNIVDIISRYVTLKKRGRNYLGLCPFHTEKTPSFSVNAEKQIFHCFGCKKGGDIFAFWTAYHQVSFPQAMRDLAEKYHVSLPEPHPGRSGQGQAEAREAILKLNETAARFFHNLLTRTDQGKAGRDYFNRRGIPAEIISGFRLGYAADEWDGLFAFLKEKKVDPEKAVTGAGPKAVFVRTGHDPLRDDGDG